MGKKRVEREREREKERENYANQIILFIVYTVPRLSRFQGDQPKMSDGH